MSVERLLKAWSWGTIRLHLIPVLTCVLWMNTVASAQTTTGRSFYLSPTGNDSNSGSASSPWQTFSAALPQLNPGDSLILMDGTYNASNSGFPTIACGTNANNGTSSLPITMKAQNERKAFIAGDGNETVLDIESCSYWTFYGLRLASADSNGTSQGFPLIANNSNNLVFRRLLISNSNRYQNSTLFLLNNTNSSLVEESEFYYFHRHALNTKYGTNNVFRRNYANSRLYADIPGGYVSGESSRGDSAFIVYPGSNNIIENNISELNTTAVDIQAEQPSDSNQNLGNISLNDFYGAVIAARESIPSNTTLRNFVVIGAQYPGVYSRGAVNTQCYNCSVFNSGQGMTADVPSGAAITTPSFYSHNGLVSGNQIGFNISSQSAWQVTYSDLFGNGTNFSPTSSNFQNSLFVDPKLVTDVYVPSASPLKGAGEGGNDIGASILYRYVNGVLTNQPLWDTMSGAFTCGTVIAGLNDVSGSSCFDVNARLNVNASTLPTGYGGAQTISAPSNLRLTN